MSLPEVKTPKFVTDLVRDLRDRRLLPLVALLVVAIVAVPIALSKSAAQTPSAPDRSLIGSASTASASHLTAVPDAPGLRDYHRRLSGRHATDPFETPPSAAPSQPTSASTQSSAAAASSSASVPSSSGSTPVSAEDGSTTSGEANSVGHFETKYFSHAIDVRIVNLTSASGAAASAKAEPSVRRNLPTLTKLPSRKTPAVVFMGASSDGKKAILLISSNVRSVSGEGRCVLGSAEVCQLLALKPGSPETFVYGANGRTFRIQLLKIHLVVTHRPR